MVGCKEGAMSDKMVPYQFDMPAGMKKRAFVRCIEEETNLAEVARGLIKRWLAGEIPTPDRETQEQANDRSA